jgi:hypothetical protein
MGLARESIADNAFGDVVWFGNVEFLALGSFTTGQILWFDTVNGGLTATEPATNKIQIAAVQKASSTPSATNGILLVRIKWVSRDIDEVDGLQTALNTVGQVAGQSTKLGFEALNTLTAGDRFSTAVGHQALRLNTTGSFNTAVGRRTLEVNTTGEQNTAQGANALISNTTGNNNTAQGLGSLFSNTTGNNNTAQGHVSLFGNTTGSSNSSLGAGAGRYIANGSTANATGGNSVFIGADTKALADAQTNQIVIGHNATGIGSNTVTLGNDSIVTTALKGNVGIGTTSPSAKLELNGSGPQVLKITSTNADQTSLYLQRGTTGDNSFDYNLINDGGNFKINAITPTVQERIIILNSGNVGINETSPTAQLQVKSSATNKVPLIVDTLTSGHTANIVDFRANNATRSFIDLNGNFASSFFYNINGFNNANINTSAGGTTISRNIADANDALTINLQNASSTGLILDAQAAGTTVASIAKNGTVTAPSVVATSTVKIGAWTLSQNGTSGSLDFVVV